jgi:hypothetical protein
MEEEIDIIDETVMEPAIEIKPVLELPPAWKFFEPRHPAQVFVS